MSIVNKSHFRKSIVLYVVFFLLIVFLFTQKQNFHVDELWSYGLANYDRGTNVLIDDGKKFEDSTDPFLDYIVVKDNKRFNYGQVWENQRGDNHPVLFYILLHTVCSLFPGKFSLWYGAVINLAFAMVLLLFIRKLILYLTRSRRLQLILSIAYILLYGTLNSMTFLRMYVMCMAWCTALSYLILRLVDKLEGHVLPEEFNDHPLWYLFFCTYAVTALSGVTQYYCIFYSVMLSVTVFVYLLIKRKWKGAGLLLGTQTLAGITAILIFPTLIKHMFSGYRGGQTIDNLKEGSNQWERLRVFFTVSNQELFGSLILIILATILIFTMFYYFRNKMTIEHKSSVEFHYYVILLIPCLIYFVFVSISTPLIMGRYMYPIYPTLFAVVFCLFGSLLSDIMIDRKTVATIIMMIVMACTVGMSYFSNQDNYFEYLYLGSNDNIKTASKYSDVDCLCIYRYNFQILPSYLEISQFKSVTFIKQNEFEQLNELEIKENQDLMVVNIDDWNHENAINVVLKAYPQFTKAQFLYRFINRNTYYLS